MVRMRYHLAPMEKAYFPLFTDQVFTVTAVTKDHPRHMYRLKTWDDKILERKFYSEDLVRVADNVDYRIEKVLKRRGNAVLVKWTGYPHSANTWISNRITELRNV